MILETIKEEILHPNGNVSYRAERSILSKSHAHLYPNRRIHPDGYEWIYSGLCGKWDSDGKQKWVIMYNSMGEVMSDYRHNHSIENY